jgi:hypothetical protein
VCHGKLSKRPRSGIVAKYQGATRSCPGKLEHFPAKIPSWAIDEISVKFHGQLFLMVHGTLLVAHGTFNTETQKSHGNLAAILANLFEIFFALKF